MIKHTVAFAAAFVVSTASAFAAGPIIPAGVYAVTTQYTAVTDPSGICAAAGVAVGGTTSGFGSVGGAGKAATSVVAQPTTAAQNSAGEPYMVNNLTCVFPAFPAVIKTNGSTPYNGTTTCTTNYSALTKGPASFTITTSNGNIVTGPALTLPDTENVFHVVSTGSTVASGGTTLCTISTDQLIQRTGK